MLPLSTITTGNRSNFGIHSVQLGDLQTSPQCNSAMGNGQSLYHRHFGVTNWGSPEPTRVQYRKKGVFETRTLRLTFHQHSVWSMYRNRERMNTLMRPVKEEKFARSIAHLRSKAQTILISIFRRDFCTMRGPSISQFQTSCSDSAAFIYIFSFWRPSEELALKHWLL
jgi:hypothetical protein